jgi:geranylgeranyl diphosphate synthase type 3
MDSSKRSQGVPERSASVETEWADDVVESILLEPFTYIERMPGKNVRSMLIDAFNEWLQVPTEKTEAIKKVIGMLHNASLIIDDIQDNSSLRRGIPVAHHVYGVANTINCGNYVYFQCMQMVIDMGEPLAAQAFTEQLLELHRGQGMDIYWRDAGVCPSELQYKEMVKRKTGGLFGLAVRLMQLHSESKQDFSRVLELLGLHFQIRDDYANLLSDEYAENKSFAEDITEGKFSFPIIHSIRTTPQNHEVINILRQRTNDITLKKHMISVLERTNSFAYTRDVLLLLEADLLAEIEKLGGNSKLGAIVAKLSQLYKEEKKS